MFFTAINQMMTEGVDLTLVIRKANGQLAVSTLPKSNGLKDEAQNHIVPLTVNGKPEELDAVKSAAEVEMDEAVKFADESPYPDPATVLDDMYVTDNERCVAR